MECERHRLGNVYGILQVQTVNTVFNWVTFISYYYLCNSTYKQLLVLLFINYPKCTFSKGYRQSKSHYSNWNMDVILEADTWNCTQPNINRLVSEKIYPCPQKPINVREYPEDLAPLRSILLISRSRWPKSTQSRTHTHQKGLTSLPAPKPYIL